MGYRCVLYFREINTVLYEKEILHINKAFKSQVYMKYMYSYKKARHKKDLRKNLCLAHKITVDREIRMCSKRRSVQTVRLRAEYQFSSRAAGRVLPFLEIWQLVIGISAGNSIIRIPPITFTDWHVQDTRMRKGGTAVPLIITVPTRGLGSGATTETGAILMVKVTQVGILTIERARGTTGILTVAARQDPKLTKTDRVVIPIVAATDTTHTVVIDPDFVNYHESQRIYLHFRDCFKSYTLIYYSFAVLLSYISLIFLYIFLIYL